MLAVHEACGSTTDLCAEESEVPPVYKMFASVSFQTGQPSNEECLSGLVCCAGSTFEECEGVAAKAQALYARTDPRSIIGLRCDADLDSLSREQVECAYRKSALRAHPDKGGSKEELRHCKDAKCVLLDPGWREAYKRCGWAGVHAAWSKASSSHANLVDKALLPAEAKPRFVGVALHDGRVAVVSALALKLIAIADEERDLFESPHWLLLPKSSKGGFRAATDVDAFLQPPEAGNTLLPAKALNPRYFAISAILPSNQCITLQRNLPTDTVAALVTCIAGQAGLDDCSLYVMHGSSCLNSHLTLQQCNLQECSTLRVLSRDALPGGVGGTDDYFSTHQRKLEAAMTQVMSEVLSVEPPDPVSFMAHRFAALSSEPVVGGMAASQPVHETKGKLPLPSEDEGASDQWNLVSWLAGAGLHRVVAGAIQHAVHQRGLGNRPEDTLRFLRGLKDRGEVAKLIREEETLETLTDLVWGEVTVLQSAGAATTSEMQSKFAGSVELSYGGLDSFFGGLEGVIGSPNPKLLEAMAADHIDGQGTESTDEFVTGNYGVRTSSKVEWLFVCDPEATAEQLNLECWPEESKEKLLDRSKCRRRRPLVDILAEAESRNQALEKANQPRLVKEELVAANLYTGPVRTATFSYSSLNRHDNAPFPDIAKCLKAYSPPRHCGHCACALTTLRTVPIRCS